MKFISILRIRIEGCTSAKYIVVFTWDIDWKLFDIYCDNKAHIRTN